MTVGVWNILDLVDNFGDDYVNEFISDFSTKSEKDGQIVDLNPDIESFLKKNAIQFAKEKKSITYIVGDKDDGSFLGYFTITHKPIEIPAVGLSKTTVRKLEKHSRLKEASNVYVVSAFLIAQFGKNYSVDHGVRITGNDLMNIALMPDIKDDFILPEIKHPMQRHRQLDHAQVGRQMSAGPRHGMYQFLPDFRAKGPDLLRIQILQILWIFDFLQKHLLHPLSLNNTFPIPVRGRRPAAKANRV